MNKDRLPDQSLLWVAMKEAIEALGAADRSTQDARRHAARAMLFLNDYIDRTAETDE